VDANEEWGVLLDNGESLTCIAHYIPDINGIPESLVFSQTPEFTDTYTGGDRTGWQTVLSDDQKMVYLYGPRTTNDTGQNDIGWFSYTLFFQWDDEDANLDPTFPVYIDTAVFDGPLGCAFYDEWGWRGKPGPGNGEDWEYQSEPYYEDGYTNPAPEPMTICLFGLGAVFLRIRKRPLNLK
jgi:hypothetical protein